MGLFDGKVAIITGAGGGIGRCHALAFAAEGAKVVVNDVGGARDGTGTGASMADRVVEEIRTAGGEAAANYDSVCSEEGAQNLIKTAVDAFGGVDIVVNNAGILRDKTLMKLTMDNWEAVMAVHATGTFLVSKFAAIQMKEQGRGGKIVNTSSYAGLKGNFGQANYACAKAGIYGLTVVCALELQKHNVQVNVIAPMAKTRMTEDISMVPEEMLPEQISPMVLFLASKLADDITGTVYGIHGQQIFEYQMKMTDGVTKEGDELWTPAEIADKIELIRQWQKPAPAAAAGAPREVTDKDKCDAIFDFLPEFFVPEKAAGWTATVHFKVAGAADYTLSVADGKCSTSAGLEGTPTCVVSTDADTFTGMAEQKVNAAKAFMEGKIKATNLNDMMRFQPAFPFKADKVAQIMDKLKARFAAAGPAAAPAREITAKDKLDAIFDHLPEFFVAEKAAGWNATVHFKVAGAADYTLVIADGTCSTASGLEGTPTCVVSTDAETFGGMAEQKVNPAKAFMEGKIKATNLNDMMRFQPAFPFKPEKVAKVMAALEAKFAGGAAPAAAPAREITAKDKCDAIFKFLPEFFVAEKAAGWNATLQFKIAGAADYTLSVADGKCSTSPGLEGTPTCVVSTDADTFTGMAEQKVNAAKAFMEGKIKATNLNDMMRFQPAFPFKPERVAKVMADLKAEFGGGAAAPAAAPEKPKPTGLNFDMVGHSVSGGYAMVDEEATRAYAAATNDENPYYVDGDREGGVIAPPLFPVKLLADGLFKLITDDNLRADMLRLVHGEQDMIFHDAIRPGDLVSMRGDIEEIIEKSSGNLVNCLGKIYRDGKLLCEARSGLFIRGKKKGDKSARKEAAAETEREELFTETQVVDEDQSFRYAKASGDENPIHVDESVAKAAGLPGIILHGLCTMAFTGRAVVQNACAGDPTRLRRLKVRFAKPVLPGDTLTTTAWKVEANDGVQSIGFETRNQDDVVVISNGLAEVRS